jgi:hypothetical protein
LFPYSAKKRYTRFLSKCGIRKWALSALSPLRFWGSSRRFVCYGTIPIAASFAGIDTEPRSGEGSPLAKGMAEDAVVIQPMIAAFCMTPILLNPHLLFYSAALGVPALVIRFVN